MHINRRKFKGASEQFLAHLSQRLIGELIVYLCSGVRRRRRCRRRRPPFSKIFSETAWPIKAKFYVEPLWEGGTKVYKSSRSHDQDGRHDLFYGKVKFGNLSFFMGKSENSQFFSYYCSQ